MARARAETYRHEDEALLRPEVGTQAGKAERLSFDVPTLPLFVHERLSTKAIRRYPNAAVFVAESDEGETVEDCPCRATSIPRRRTSPTWG
jgi:hypothetical protein